MTSTLSGEQQPQPPLPTDPAALNGMATLLIRRGAYAQAQALLQRAVEAAPGNPVALYNLGIGYRRLGQVEAAAAAFRSAMAAQPVFPQAQFNLSLCMLALGQWREAWPLWDARHAARGLTEPALPYPRWRGESLTGKRLLVWLDDGLGDEIQVFRYAFALQAQGLAALGWLASPALADLFAANAPSATIFRAEAPLNLPRHDYWVPALSLPGLLGAEPDQAIGAGGYIAAPADRLPAWQARLQRRDGALRVGLAWKGASGHVNDAHRSLPGIETLRGLWDLAGAEFFSLQKGPGQSQAATPPADQPLTDLAPFLTDMAQTAAAIAQLDAVVSVDTAVAHLSGAMGKPCLLLLPAMETDWRWMLNRDDTPWYDSLTLVRQAAPGDWSGAVSRAAAMLADRART
jgi:hypothetical protein